MDRVEPEGPHTTDCEFLWEIIDGSEQFPYLAHGYTILDNQLPQCCCASLHDKQQGRLAPVVVT